MGRKPTTRFHPPTLNDVFNYFESKGLNSTQARDQTTAFLDHYESNGWKVGKNKMVKWKAAASGWLRRSPMFTAPTQDNRTTVQGLTDRSWAEGRGSVHLHS